MQRAKFDDCFCTLTGNPTPLSWQRRLYGEWLSNEVKPIIDLPTGMGKTAVMAIWLIARAENASLGHRLIYVVDRRTVVDQATSLAEKIAKIAGNACLEVPAISTLRGQRADTREWSADPSRAAIIIGTVDLIGSALLFSGYRSSYKRRPLEAGLLGQDSLLILDEAHLSKPFEKLICAISDAGRFQKTRNNSAQGKPMRVIRMSATSGQSNGKKPFTLQFDENGKLAGDDAKDAIISERFGAKKRLTITTLGKNDDLNKKLADAAIELARKPDLVGKRIVVFVRKPEDARSIAEKIRDYEKPSKSKSNPDPKGPYISSVEVLTGTMRGLERDELVDKPVLKRFLDGDENPTLDDNKKPVFLVSTSAGEVGFDLNADHLVGDAAPLDSWIQRLGRVNRRGKGDATVILVKDKDCANKTGFDKACIATSKLFTDGMDVSLKALASFKRTLTSEQIDEASSPKPTMVELTDILLDAWSMTSIVEPMPGRPEVAPWIRGIDEELPQTVIAWRAELDLPGFDQLDLDTIEEWFDTHRVLTHETLSVPTSAAAKWFTDRWDKLDDKQKSEAGSRPIVVNRAGLKLVTVNEVINQLGRKNTDSIRNADLILPASFGGIERGKGLLNAHAPEIPNDEGKKPLEERKAAKEARLVAPDVADIAPSRQRLREVIIKPEDGEQDAGSLGSGAKPAKSSRFTVELESDHDRRVQLVSYVPKFEKVETGSEPQSLEKHVTRVRYYADEIIRPRWLPKIQQLGLKPDDPIRLALELAADWHDHGKNREFFQRTVGGTPSPGGRPWPEQTRGKSGGKDFGKAPRGYRHEFGSLREFTDAIKGKISDEVFDLAMHMIATHHGRGRPHFPRGGFDPEAESRSAEIHADAIRRFARLQRRYGWWYLAWLENLLRCADALASAESDADNAQEARHE